MCSEGLMNKPAFLFHGSCNGIEGALTPRPQHGDVNGRFPEGIRHLVFATDDPSLAATYTLKNKYMLSAGTTDGRNFAVFRDYDSWKQTIDAAPCSVYVLPSDTFTNTLNKTDGRPTPEWLSPVAVQPQEIRYQTPETVMQTGAQLFFLDKGITEQLWHYDPSKPADSSFLNRITAKQQAGLLPSTFTPMDLHAGLMQAGLMRHLNAETNIQPIEVPHSPCAAIIQEDIDWLKQQVAVNTAPDRADGKPWAASLGARTGRARAAAE